MSVRAAHGRGEINLGTDMCALTPLKFQQDFVRSRRNDASGN